MTEHESSDSHCRLAAIIPCNSHFEPLQILMRVEETFYSLDA